MSDSVQYVTNAEGKKVGVLLDLETYQQLTNLSVDSELLIGLNLDELQALAESYLSPKAQIQLQELLGELPRRKTDGASQFIGNSQQELCSTRLV
jgi:hypothetical protein